MSIRFSILGVTLSPVIFFYLTSMFAADANAANRYCRYDLVSESKGPIYHSLGAAMPRKLKRRKFGSFRAKGHAINTRDDKKWARYNARYAAETCISGAIKSNTLPAVCLGGKKVTLPGKNSIFQFAVVDKFRVHNPSLRQAAFDSLCKGLKGATLHGITLYAKVLKSGHRRSQCSFHGYNKRHFPIDSGLSYTCPGGVVSPPAPKFKPFLKPFQKK